MPVDPLTALATSRATGAPPLACLAGLHAVDDATLGLGPGPIGVLDVAMLADLGLGRALRRLAGPGQRMPTITLDLHLNGHPARGEHTTVHIPSAAITDGIGTAAGTLRHNGSVAGHCAATFAVPSRDGGHATLPWDWAAGTAPEPLPPNELSADERAVLALLDGARPWTDRMLESMDPAPVMANRAGAVQGAVLFALAARSAVQTGTVLVSGRMSYLAAAAVQPLQVTSETVHATRRTTFRHTALRQDGRLVATASFVTRTAAG